MIRLFGDFRQRADHRGTRRRQLPVDPADPVELAPDNLRRADAQGHRARAESRLIIHEQRGTGRNTELFQRVPEDLR